MSPHPEDDSERITVLETVVFGVDSKGGMMSKVEHIQTIVQDHEQKLNTISLKLGLLIGGIVIGMDYVYKILSSVFAVVPHK